MSVQTINYRRRHNYQDGDFSTPVEQRWPVTPSRARRAAVDSTLAAYSPGNRAYQWVRVGAIASSPTPATPVLSLDIGSMDDDVDLVWTQASDPDSTEVWRSVNGAPYALLDTIAGTLLTYNDSDGLGSTDIWCWKIRGVIAGNPGSFSNVVCATRNLDFVSAASVAEPTWLLGFGTLQAANPTVIETLAFAGLLKVTGDLGLGGMINLETLSLPALVKVDGTFFFDSDGFVGGAFATFSLPSLVSIGGDLQGDSTSLVTLSFPVLAGLSGNLNISNSAGLVTFSAPSLPYQDGKTYDFRACSLSAASIEGILAQARASAPNTATIQLEDGANAGLTSLSAQGQLDYAILAADGNTMTSNP